ncbi:hypothetical protein PGT21_009141 [Puccinia graminis f. sp. tritici]|uniref:Uncharacterized protein n=1 Tax=Puccinia graminis f. sp. tritici TaxID=56615 RepID=A0A5B0N542_PUCGR|nr:hypothetical protein PGTUg99_027365 [Puccinia graminis f. sp. tritici]KAA1083852.1 hypothetical protein PGT21_009141 [Puccinia graminis f. sp. tritici]
MRTHGCRLFCLLITSLLFNNLSAALSRKPSFYALDLVHDEYSGNSKLIWQGNAVATITQSRTSGEYRLHAHLPCSSFLAIGGPTDGNTKIVVDTSNGASIQDLPISSLKDFSWQVAFNHPKWNKEPSMLTQVDLAKFLADLRRWVAERLGISPSFSYSKLEKEQ